MLDDPAAPQCCSFIKENGQSLRPAAVYLLAIFAIQQ
jgi:hypothetical protein